MLQKRSEAGIVKVANVSDVKVIDKAKDVGQGPVAPNPKTNYIIALFVGIFFPLLPVSVIQPQGPPR